MGEVVTVFIRLGGKVLTYWVSGSPDGVVDRVKLLQYITDNLGEMVMAHGHPAPEDLQIEIVPGDQATGPKIVDKTPDGKWVKLKKQTDVPVNVHVSEG